MAELTYGYGQPLRQNQPAPASTNWVEIYNERTPFGSETATFIPALDPGMFFTGMYIRTVAAGGVGDGHNFQIAFNYPTAPTFGYEVGAASGADFVGAIPVHNIWVKLSDASDLIDFIGLG